MNKRTLEYINKKRDIRNGNFAVFIIICIELFVLIQYIF